MKVCTDACIFGAWFAKKTISPKNILDLGSGTGLLMLMLAQQHDADFLGIEIDANCFEQLKENLRNSKWSERLEARLGDVRDFRADLKFDFIISNPPFYENSLAASSASSNLARHSSHLKLEELLTAIDRNLSSAGSFAVLLPFHRSEEFEARAEKNKFHLMEKLLVKQSPRHDFFRSILHYSRSKGNTPVQEELVIQNEAGGYTDQFIELLNDYYLYLKRV